MFRHRLALPSISNAIYIPQKRSQTLWIKPNHNPSQSLHLCKMFIFSSCRLQGARQQIWPAAAHHANAASTNGRLAVKTPNRTLSGLVSVSLITKETNTGKCRRSGFGEESRSPFGERPGSCSLSCCADFVSRLCLCPLYDQVACWLFFEGSRCLTTALPWEVNPLEFTGDEGTWSKTPSMDATHQPPSSVFLRGTQQGHAKEGEKEECDGPVLRSRAKEETSPCGSDLSCFLHSWHPEPAPATLFWGPEAMRHKCASKQDLGSRPPCMQDLTLTQPNCSYYWLIQTPAVSGRSPWPGGPTSTSRPFS